MTPFTTASQGLPNRELFLDQAEWRSDAGGRRIR